MLISTVSVCYVTQHFIVDHVTNPTNRIERLRITLRNEILLLCAMLALENICLNIRATLIVLLMILETILQLRGILSQGDLSCDVDPNTRRIHHEAKQ